MNQEEFIRDICKVTPMSKSEARNSLNLIITQTLAEEKERVRELIKEAFITGYKQGNDIQLFYRDLTGETKEDVDIVLADILSSLDKPLTDN